MFILTVGSPEEVWHHLQWADGHGYVHGPRGEPIHGRPTGLHPTEPDAAHSAHQ